VLMLAAGGGLSSVGCCLQGLPKQIQPSTQNRSLVPAFETWNLNPGRTQRSTAPMTKIHLVSWTSRS
jgi:hypothetical protein